MKTIKLLVATFAAGLVAASTQATILNVVSVDFQSPGTTYSGQGAIAAPGSFWTGTGAVSAGSLPDSLGVATTAGFTRAGFSGAGSIGAVNALIDDYFFDTVLNDVDGHDFRLEITGLTDSKNYLLALYGAQNGLGGRGTTWTIGAQSKVSDASSFASGGFVENSTYVLFSGIAPLSGKITIYGDEEFAGAGVSFLNGFQIQEMGVPEPSVALLLLSGGLLIWKRKWS